MTPLSVETAKQEVLDLMSHQWTTAVSEKDRAWFDRHVDEQWRYIDYTGAQRGFEEYWAIIQGVASYVEEMRRFDVRLVAGCVALVTGVYLGRVELHGGLRLEKLLSFSAVWELREGVWKACLHHTTEPQG